MRANRIYTAAVAILVPLCLLVPFLIFLLTPASDVSRIEKRKLAPFPSVAWEYDSIREFPENFTSYYQDHFGLREVLVNFYNSSMLNIFETSPSSSVIKGLDDWYFYTAGDIAKDHYGLKNVNAQQLETFSQTLIDHRDWLQSMGIRYLFVPVPNKMNVYSDKLPERIQGLGARTYYEQLTSYRQGEIAENIVDVFTLLKETKKEHDVYHRTDTHWNYEGALDVFNQIIKQLNYWFPEVHGIENKDFDGQLENFSGDLTNMLHQLEDISENNVQVVLKSPCSSKTYDSKLSEHLYEKINDRDPENRALPIENGCKKEKLTVLLIHDSFGLYLRPYFNERFHRVIYSNKYNFSELQEFIVTLKPDIVIEQRVARDINSTLARDIELETKVVEYQMTETGKEVVLDINSDKKIDAIQSQYNTVISTDERGYQINATTADPQLFFQCKQLNKDKRYNAMLELTVPSDTQMQLFYMPMGNSAYNAEYSILRQVRRGYNKLFFHIPGPVIKGDIRLDPGAVAGSYVLHALTIKER